MAVAKGWPMRLRAFTATWLAPCALALGQTVGTGAASGSVRLCERIEAPMAYVAIDTSAIAAGEPNPLLDLLPLPAADREADPAAGAALAFVRSVVARASGEVEVALLGVLPGGVTGGGDRPLIVVRTRLSSADAARMRQVLADPTVAQPGRQVHGHQAFTLAAGAGHGDRREWHIEAAVVGDDLLVANNASGLDEALEARTTTAARGLIHDPRYQLLRERLGAAPGALVAFADWRRLGARLQAIGGLGGAVLGWSGLQRADALAAAVAAMPGPAGADGVRGLRSTVLLSFAPEAPIHGWLDLLEPAPAPRLVDEVPVGGLGGFVFAVEPERVVEAARDAKGFCASMGDACGRCGIDLQRVCKRLGKRGALQLLLVPGQGAQVTPALALQTVSRKAAVDIVEEVARALAGGERLQRPAGSVALRDCGGLDLLHLQPVDDLLVFAAEPAAAAALATARRERSRGRAAVEAAVTAALRAFAADRGERLGGLLAVDTAPLLAVGTPRARTFPSNHTGLLDVQRGAAATVVRLRVLSTR